MTYLYKKPSYKLVSATTWKELYKGKYPNAVHNKEKSEYILSLNDSKGDMTREQAQEYKADNWAIEGEL